MLKRTVKSLQKLQSEISGLENTSLIHTSDAKQTH